MRGFFSFSRVWTLWPLPLLYEQGLFALLLFPFSAASHRCVDADGFFSFAMCSPLIFSHIWRASLPEDPELPCWLRTLFPFVTLLQRLSAWILPRSSPSGFPLIAACLIGFAKASTPLRHFCLSPRASVPILHFGGLLPNPTYIWA